MTKKDVKKPRRTLGNSHSVKDKEIIAAEFYLYTRLHRKYGPDYDDPFASGPEAMADYIDAFLEFIKQTYPDHGLGDVENLGAMIRARMPTLKKFQEASASSHPRVRISFWNKISDELFEVVSEMIRGMPKETLARLLRDYSPRRKKD